MCTVETPRQQELSKYKMANRSALISTVDHEVGLIDDLSQGVDGSNKEATGLFGRRSSKRPFPKLQTCVLPVLAQDR